MKYQLTDHGCGPAALCNALACFGMVLKEKEIAKLAKTTKRNGTSEEGIKTALDSLGFQWTELSHPTKFRKSLTDGHPVVAVVEKYSHWITIVGKLGKNFVVVDPDKSKVGRMEIAVFIVSKDELKNYGKYYGISISRKPGHPPQAAT